MLSRIFAGVTILGILASPAVAQAPRQVRIISASANVRQGPGTNQTILGSLSSGTVLEVIRDANPWFQVRLSPELGLRAATGYVHSSTVEIVRMVMSSQPTPAPTRVVQTVVVPQPASTSAPMQQLVRPGYKEGGTAMIIGFLVPGGGQMYAGETKKGLVLLGGGLGGLIVGVALSAGSVSASCGNYGCSDDTNYAPAALGYLAYLGTWIYGIIDADDSADRMNAKNGYVRAAVRAAPVVGNRGSGFAVGVRLSY